MEATLQKNTRGPKLFAAQNRTTGWFCSCCEYFVHYGENCVVSTTNLTSGGVRTNFRC